MPRPLPGLAQMVVDKIVGARIVRQAHHELCQPARAAPNPLGVVSPLSCDDPQAITETLKPAHPEPVEGTCLAHHDPRQKKRARFQWHRALFPISYVALTAVVTVRRRRSSGVRARPSPSKAGLIPGNSAWESRTRITPRGSMLRWKARWVRGHTGRSRGCHRCW